MSYYHYTSNKSFVSIVSNRSFRMSELSLSNDYLEGKWLRNVFSEACDKKNVKAEHKAELLVLLDRVLGLFTYVGFCLSKKRDSLSQWIGYADDGCGVSIKLDRQFVENLAENGVLNRKIERVDVVYSHSKQVEMLASHIEKLRRYIERGAFARYGLLSLYSDDQRREHAVARSEMWLYFLNFISMAYSMKNPAFGEEKEVRLISNVPVLDEGSVIKFNGDVLGFYANNDVIVPFIDAPIEGRRAIREVILGPKNRTPVYVIKTLLEKYGFEKVKVEASNASYR